MVYELTAVFVVVVLFSFVLFFLSISSPFPPRTDYTHNTVNVLFHSKIIR